MSLLETRNKKFNVPFVFIAGVIFLIGLAYFANYLENLSQNTTDETVEKAEKIIKIQVDENGIIFIDGTEIDENQLEETLKIQFDGHANPVVQLETKVEITSQKLTSIMDIATKNNYKIILETDSK